MPAVHPACCPKDWHCCPAAGCSLRPLVARSQLCVTTARWVHAQRSVTLAGKSRRAATSYSTPLATCRCTSARPRPLVCPFVSPIQVVLYVGGFTKPDLQLFSAAGLPLGRVLWDSRARVVAAGWTKAEQLLVVDDAAQARTGT